MSGAPSISGTAKFASPANAGMMKRKIISAACSDTSPLKVCVSTYCMSGLASSARKIIAMQAADDEEEERRHEVLDADHLVVGVDLEVVAPAVRAVARVVVHARRAARDVVEPVVEGSDSGEEPDRRRRQEGDDGDHRPVPGRVVVPEPAEEDDDPGADRPEERRHPGGPEEPRGGQMLHAAPRRRRRVVGFVRMDDLGHLRPSCPSTRYCTSASSCSSVSDLPKVFGITSG